MSTNTQPNSQKKEKTVKFRPEFYPGTLEEDVNIQVNGKRYVFPRGKEVEVPEHIYKEFLRSGNAALSFHKTIQRLQYDDPVAGKAEPAGSYAPLVT